jgi:hypothetical protein
MITAANIKNLHLAMIANRAELEGNKKMYNTARKAFLDGAAKALQACADIINAWTNDEYAMFKARLDGV